jgi:hypothetical protein
MNAYQWKTNVNGFGTRYAQASPNVNGPVDSFAWTANNTDIIVGKNGSVPSVFLYAYAWTFYGFGTKYADPVSGPGDGIPSVALNKNNRDVAYTEGFSPYISVHPFTSGTGWGTQYANPATLPTSTAYGVSWRPQQNAVATGLRLDPFLYVCRWIPGAGGFGTKFTDPGAAIRPTGTVYASDWGPVYGLDVGFGHDNSPYATIYQWNATTGFVAKWTNPATLPPNRVSGLKWNPDETVLTAATSQSPYVNAWEWDYDTGWGTKYSNPATLPAGPASAVSWRKNGTDIAVSHNVSPYISVYPWSNGFGTKYANPASLPTDDGDAVEFSI